jgi:ribosome-associated protein
MQESDDLPERPSKTERKKQMLALQKIGEILVLLPAPQLAKISLPSPLAEAVQTARELSDHEGRRRQLQYIGKLMRNVEVEPIEAAIRKIQLKDQLSVAKFQQIEKWRDKLIKEGDDTLQVFLQKYPQTDAQKLRQLQRNAQKEFKAEKSLGADTMLFRYLRDVIEEN